MARESDRDVRSEIKIALFWRHLIGDYEYVKFDPDDMLRWYDALELRGHLEIRQLMTDRYGTRPAGTIQGIVSKAPHPPSWLVREWLAHYEQKVRTGGVWVAAGAFVLSSFVAFPMLYGCTALKPVSPFYLNPPSSQPQVMAPSQMPAGSNYAPTAAIPPAVVQPGPTMPTSQGIAGAASGVAPASGATGPATVGASSSAVSAAPSVGSGDP
jgi:hypothetical protein